MSAKGAEQWISNPIGKTLDQVGIERPKVNIGGYNLDLTAMTTGLGAIGQVQNVATKYEEERQVAKFEKQQQELYKADVAQLEKFKQQEGTLLTGNQELFIPKYKSVKSGKMAKETEALAQVFNQRKQEIVQRRSTPGVSQTRTM
jgi:hypothetical protein